MSEQDKTPAPDDSVGATRVRALPPKTVLRGVSGPYFGKVIALSGRITIGRDADCDLTLDEPEISRKHAVIEATAGGLFLRDLGSVNGSFVNGAWVREAELKIGDQIGFDRDRFLVESLVAPSRSQPGNSRPESPPPPPAASGPGVGLWIIAILVAIGAGALVWYLVG